MKLGEFFDLSVEKGIEVDVRGKERILSLIKNLQREYEAMDEEAKASFDTERLKNPFGDTRILYGRRDREIKTFMTGINIDERHLLYAEALRRRGKRVDLIVSHHAAIGWGLLSLEDILSPMVDRMVGVGMPEKVAKEEVERFRLSKLAWYGSRCQALSESIIRMAEEFDFPLVTIHTPADNYNLKGLRDIIDRDKPETVGEAVDRWNREIPEFAYASRFGDGVRLVAGEPRNKLGKIYYSQGLGWSPDAEIMEKICRAGVTTCVITIPSEECEEVARRHGVGLVHIPHHPVDWLGMNLLYDELIRGRDIQVVPCSDYRRFEREKGGKIPQVRR